MVEKVPAAPDEGEPARLRFHRDQDAQGHLPLSPVDPDARWRRQSKWRPAIFGDKERVIVDKSGFILARRVTPADANDPEGAIPLLDRLPIQPKSLGAEAGYRAGCFRQALRRRGITPFIPVACRQGGVVPGETVDPHFTDPGDHVVCRQGKHLKMASFPNTEGGVQFVALQADCQACPIRATCLAPNEKRTHVQISRDELEFRRARRLNATVQYQREMQRRKTVVEGVFARLDRLGWDEARGRGSERGDCQGSIAVLGHDILKALTKRRFRKRTACAKTPEIQSSATSASASFACLRCLSFPLSYPPSH